MEQHDIDLIEKYGTTDKLLGVLYRQHVDFERQLEKYNSKPFLTPFEEVERKRIQKLKLKGRDQIEEILRDLRKRESLRCHCEGA